MTRSRELAHLGQAVGDVDDGGAGARRARGPGRRAGRRRRAPSGAVGSSRIEQLRVDRERLGDLEQVPLRDGQRLDPVARGRRVEPDVARACRRGRLGRRCPPAKHGGGQGHPDVLEHGHVGQHRGVLVDDRDAELRRRARGRARSTGSPPTRDRARRRAGRRRRRRSSASTCRRRSRRAARAPRRPDRRARRR